jgi:FlaA1/EpsC-like NDP-sugar epimerase
MFNDKTLLITGGTGSFGNAVIKKFLDKRIISRKKAQNTQEYKRKK